MNASGETVLVTGGTGFVAGWCIVELLQRGYRVRTTVRDPSKQAAVRGAVLSAGTGCDRLSFAVADLTSDDGWDAAVAGCDFVLHVASPLGRDATGNELIAPGARRNVARASRSNEGGRQARRHDVGRSRGATCPMAQAASATRRSGPTQPIASLTPTGFPRFSQNVPHGISWPKTPAQPN